MEWDHPTLPWGHYTHWAVQGSNLAQLFNTGMSGYFLLATNISKMLKNTERPIITWPFSLEYLK